MITAPKDITFRFKPPTELPTTKGYKLAIFEIFMGNDRMLEYGQTEWDGEIFGLPDEPAAGYTVSLFAWADTVDPEYEAPKIIRL